MTEEAKRKNYVGYLFALAGVAAVTLLAFPFGESVNHTSIALVYLLAVLAAASVYGSRPAVAASLFASLCFNFFFFPPYYTIAISDSENWIALFVFLAVSLIVGQLSATARHRAEEAERLYTELQETFEKASQAEALERSEKLKSALLDAVTHDLRTPLTSIKAATTMLIDESRNEAIHATLEPDGRTDLLETINEETDRLNEFVESMVGLAKLEAGEVDWKRTAASVDEIVAVALQRAAGLLGNRRTEVRIAGDLPPISVDERSIAEVIYNLIDNAVKYSPPEGRVIIEANKTPGGVGIAVEDEGVGIPTEERENVFRKFYRVNKSAKGFGMGLSIVKAIVEAHGGSIRVEPGRVGSRFVFELPAESK